jgi:iron(III) transport system substrate-binding protein
MRNIVPILLIAVVVLALMWLLAPEDESDVVLYCGVDQDQSRQIAARYEEEAKKKVYYQGEIESQRAIGLPQKLRDERDNPRADVFWSNEIMNTVDLAGRGILDKLPEGVAEAFPEEWRDPDGRYVAFGARARIFLVNTELLPDEADWPKSVQDLLDPKYKEMGLTTCMARPLTGTTYTHAVALLTKDEAEGKRFLDDVAAAGADGRVKLVASNGRAMNQVRDAKNKVAFCLTDTDDAWVAIRAGDPVKVIYPDQGDDAFGTVLIPNTVSLVKKRPHPEEAAALLKWLVTAENEVRLAKGPSAQIPLRTDLAGADLPEHVKRPGTDFKAAIIPWKQVGDNRDTWLDYLNRKFRPASMPAAVAEGPGWLLWVSVIVLGFLAVLGAVLVLRGKRREP